LKRYNKNQRVMTAKERIMNNYPLMEEEDYQELEKLGFVPDKLSKMQQKKAEDLFSRELKEDVFETYTDDELIFLGRMDLSRLGNKSRSLAYLYMSRD
jgi:hypothetical protein